MKRTKIPITAREYSPQSGESELPYLHRCGKRASHFGNA